MGWDRRRTSRLSTGAMALASVVALVVLVVEGHNQWFFNDDWGQWATNRSGPALSHPTAFFFDPHNGHWMTLNRVVFEGIYRLFGLHSYLPYLVPVFAVHLAAAWLLRLLCIRAGVDAWIATGVGVVFALFGSGAEIFTWADAFGFAAPLVLAGSQLVLTDHDGPLDRRDVIGLALGLLSIASGGPSLTMVLVIAVSLAMRGRIRALLLAAVPPAAAWSAWYAWKGHAAATTFVDRDHIGSLAAYFFHGVSSSVESATQLGVAGVLIVVLAAFVARAYPQFHRRGVAPIAALACGLIAFFAETALTRVNLGVELAASSRYQYVGGFLILPLVGLALDRAVRWDRRLLPACIALLGWSAAANLFAIDSFARPWGQRKQVIEEAVATVVQLPGVRSVPAGTHIVDPEGGFDPEWVAPVDVLVALHDHGDLPGWSPPTEPARLRWGTAVLVRTEPAGAAVALTATVTDARHARLTTRADGCIRVEPDGAAAPVVRVRVDAGTAIVVRDAPAGAVEVSLQSLDDGTLGPAKHLDLAAGSATRVVLGVPGTDALITLPVQPVTLCG